MRHGHLHTAHVAPTAQRRGERAIGLKPVASSEAETIRLARGGDSQAFTVLLERHRPRVMAVAWRLTRDARAASEIAHEAFVRLQGALPTFRHDAALGTWLYRIVVNLCHDHARDSERAQATLTIDTVRDLASPDPRPDAKVEAAERSRIIDRVVQTLPPAMREAVVLRYAGGLAYNEIADAQGCAPGTVASRIHRALQLIGILLEEQGITEGSL